MQIPGCMRTSVPGSDEGVITVSSMVLGISTDGDHVLWLAEENVICVELILSLLID